MTPRAATIEAFLSASGMGDARRERIAGDASNRAYDRLTQTGGHSVILMDAPPDKGEDVRPFIAIAQHLRRAGLSAPEILHADAGAGLLLIEDFGDELFAKRIAADPSQTDRLYRLACDVLLKLREVPCPDLPLCDAEWLTTMVAPAFEFYAGAPQEAITPFAKLFRPLATQTASKLPVLMLRDYHVENLLLLPHRRGVAQAGLLDFQDAMLAHPAYDLVSILQDARRDVDPGTERAMLAYYLVHSGEDPATLLRDYAVLGLQRNLRILGVFARLCLQGGKPQYVDMIPRVWGYVERNLQHEALAHLAPVLAQSLPKPDPDFLKELKRRCPSPS